MTTFAVHRFTCPTFAFAFAFAALCVACSGDAFTTADTDGGGGSSSGGGSSGSPGGGTGAASSGGAPECVERDCTEPTGGSSSGGGSSGGGSSSGGVGSGGTGGANTGGSNTGGVSSGGVSSGGTGQGDCENLNARRAETLKAALECGGSADTGECTGERTVPDQCGCAVIVNDANPDAVKAAQEAYDAWVEGECGPHACAAPCFVSGKGACVEGRCTAASIFSP